MFVDSQTNVDYSAFYIKALYECFGKENVIFSHHFFRKLSYNGLLKIVVSVNDIHINYVIDWGDGPSIDEVDYNWCNRYGKVNFNLERTPKHYHQKIISFAR